jgi:hypothetical protein
MTRCREDASEPMIAIVFQMESIVLSSGVEGGQRDGFSWWGKVGGTMKLRRLGMQLYYLQQQHRSANTHRSI